MPEDGDAFEGDVNNDREFLAQDLDLFAVSNDTKKWWKLPEKSALHTAVTILISRGSTEEMTARIMEKIRNSIGKGDITRDNFKFTDKKLKEWGLSSDKISGIRKILSLEEVNAESLCRIKEGGIFLVNGFKVMHEEDDDVLWSEDYNVRRCLGILFFRQKNMTETEARQVGKVWAGYRSQISYFLHRLKPEGAIKIRDEEELDQYDFIGNDRPSGSSKSHSASSSLSSSSSSSNGGNERKVDM